MIASSLSFSSVGFSRPVAQLVQSASLTRKRSMVRIHSGLPFPSHLLLLQEIRLCISLWPRGAPKDVKKKVIDLPSKSRLGLPKLLGDGLASPHPASSPEGSKLVIRQCSVVAGRNEFRVRYFEVIRNAKPIFQISSFPGHQVDPCNRRAMRVVVAELCANGNGVIQLSSRRDWESQFSYRLQF